MKRVVPLQLITDAKYEPSVGSRYATIMLYEECGSIHEIGQIGRMSLTWSMTRRRGGVDRHATATPRHIGRD